MVGSQELKRALALRSSNSASGRSSTVTETGTRTGTRTPCSRVPHRGGSSPGSVRGCRAQTTRGLTAMAPCPGFRTWALLTQATTWVRPEDTMLSDVSRTREDKTGRRHSHEGPRSQIHRQGGGRRCPAAGGGPRGAGAYRHRVSLGKIKKFCDWTVVTVIMSLYRRLLNCTFRNDFSREEGKKHKQKQNTKPTRAGVPHRRGVRALGNF